MFTARVHSRVRTVNTAVFMAYLHGRVPCNSRACLRKVYMAVHDSVPRVQTVYTAVGRVHGDIHGPCMAVYKVRTWPWTAVYTGRKDDRVHGTRPCTWPCSGNVRPYIGSVHAVSSRVHGP